MQTVLYPSETAVISIAQSWLGAVGYRTSNPVRLAIAKVDYSTYDYAMIMSPTDEHTCDRYTAGDCFLLAKKLSDLGLGQLVAIVWEDDWEIWSHMAVKIGSDSYLDVEGVWSAELMLDNYSRGRKTMKIMTLTEDEYEELIVGQLPGIDSSEELEKLANSLIDWAESIGVPAPII